MLALLLLACGGEVSETTPAVCNPGTQWRSDEPAFEDQSASWGLEEIAPTGVRFSAIDFDNDGWIDLAVRNLNTVDDFGPDGTRQAWLLRNTGSGTFEDVTLASGIRQMRDGSDGGRPGAIWVWADVDNDGDLDVYTGLPDADVADVTYDAHSDILLNNGDGTFALAPLSRALSDALDQPYAASFVDVDRDGFVDLWTGQWAAAGAYQQDQLYLGDGAGGFDKGTNKAGLRTEAWSDAETINAGQAHSGAWSAVACDLNNDGWPELLAASYGRAPNHLWRAAGDGTYTNASVQSGYAFDDRDDWSDNESARCWCTLNPDSDDCEGVPEPELIGCVSNDDAFRWNHSSDRETYRLGGNSGATTCRDVNNDGWADLLTSEIVHWDVGSSSDPSELLFNDQDPEVRFRRPGNDTTGLTRTYDSGTWDDGDITGGIFDFDNDGWPDIYVGSSDYTGTRGWLWHQVAPEQFERVPRKQGIDHMRSHGSVVADFDRDGDLDIIVGHSTARCDEDCYSPAHPRLFENLTNDADAANWLQLKLVADGTTANTAAIGARVEVTSGGLTQVQEVLGGHGQWGSQDPLELHFGLGAGCDAEVTVRWPDAAQTRQTFTVQPNARYLLVMGAPEAAPRPVR
jgi:hypothetical protein